MSEKKFQFVSPGVFVEEIDRSFLADETTVRGPLVVGRSDRGPTMTPTKVQSFSEFAETFGTPIPGGRGGDVWRDGNYTSPTYASYAAQAYLRNNAPVTFVRLVGSEHVSNNGSSGVPGYNLGLYDGSPNGGGGAQGLFVFDSGSLGEFASGSIILSASADHGSDFGQMTGSLDGGTFQITGTLGNALFTFDEASALVTTTVGLLGTTNVQGIAERVTASINSQTLGVTVTYAVNGLGPDEDQTVSIRRNAVGANTDVIVDNFESGSTLGFDGGSATETLVNGTLAAVWYFDAVSGAVDLVGTQYAGSGETSGAGILIGSVGDSNEIAFKAKITNNNGSTSVVSTTAFDFNPASNRFIRKVFNTNPTLANDDTNTATDAQIYWLGETFEGNLRSGDDEQGVLGAGKYYGVILPLADYTNTAGGGNFKKDSERASSGWVFHQDFGLASAFDPSVADLRLFRLVARAKDGWTAKNIKVSIRDLKYSNNEYDKWGTFSIEVRSVRDTDANKVVLERFEDISLNPNSADFIARVIGDQRVEWDEVSRRNRTYGFYENRSKYLYVEVTDAVRDGAINERALPTGFYGPPRYNTFFIQSGSANTFGNSAYTVVNTASVFVTGYDEIKGGLAGEFIRTTSSGAFSGTVQYPKINLRVTADDRTLSDARNAYFGLETRTQEGGRLFQESYLDLVRTQPISVSDLSDTSVYFTLDDLSASGPITANDKMVVAVYNSGSRVAGTSLTVNATTLNGINYTADLDGLTKLGYDKFTLPLFGGFDGFDVREREPLANRLMTGAVTEANNFVYNTYRRAIDMVQDAEGLDINLAAVPGLTKDLLTDRLIDNCEERGDVLAIIDLENGYTPRSERTTPFSEGDNLGDVTNTVNTLKDRNINSSYGCAYYPWVLVRDTATTGQTLWVPPSVVALGVMGNSATQSELWFAPAGFNRGGLSEGDSGLAVVAVRERLSSKDRDDLYEHNVNPIATFPAEGIVIFGQKTLQVTRSALDRINVRRLLIFLKKEISFAASRILFDQNVEATWARFRGQVTPLLATVQARFGLTDYKLVLDRTTTTPELVDRNIMYAKIFLKPARAIEFIALDFIITSTGASFEE